MANHVVRRFWEDTVLRRGAHWVLTLSLFIFVLCAFGTVVLDKADNVYLFSCRDAAQIVEFVAALPSSGNPLSKFLWESLSQESRDNVQTRPQDPGVGAALVDELNNILRGNCIYDPVRFAQVGRLENEVHRLIGQGIHSDVDRIRLNRLLLEAAYKQAIPGHQVTGTVSSAKPLTLLEDRQFYILLLAAVALGGLFVGTLLGLWYKCRDPKRGFIDGIWKVAQSDNSSTAGLFAVVVLLLLLAVLANPLGWGSWGTYARALLENPGGVFALLTGAATLVGTYLALHSILEMKHTITSYSQLLSRLTNLIKVANSTGDTVSFLAYSPLSGAWNVRDQLVVQLTDTLAFAKTRVRMVCLNSDDHLALLNEFKDKDTLRKGRVTPKLIEGLQKQCEDLLVMLAGRGKHRLKDGLYSEKAEECRVEPTRLPWTQMPGYYVFVSSERAIVVVPVGIPRLYKAPGAPHELGENKPALPINVETLGFETTDRHIIQKLQDEFERYAKPDDAVSPVPCEVTPSEPPEAVCQVAGT